jgi:hypothetical protein
LRSQLDGAGKLLLAWQDRVPQRMNRHMCRDFRLMAENPDIPQHAEDTPWVCS